jgi:hypothetical protein
MDPEPAGVAPAGIGKAEGQPGGSCPSRDSETLPSGVFTVNDRFGDEFELECDEVQPTTRRLAATARNPTKVVNRDLVCMPLPIFSSYNR